MPKQRIFYIDAIKAIAIVLMITIHVPQHWHFEECFWGPLADIFCMKVFFLLSGYTTNLNKFDITKRLKLLIPMFIIGIPCTIFYSKSISTFFTSMDKNGYWFLWVMAVYGVCLFAIQKSKINIHLGFALIEIIFVAFYIAFSNNIRYLLSINLCVIYWPYVYIGQLLRNKKLFNVLIKKWWVMTLAFLAFTLLYILFQHTGALYSVFSKLYGLSFTLLLIIIGHKLYDKGAARGRIENFVSVIGQSTLQIYVLHYFFFKAFSIPSLQEFISTHNRFIDDFALTPPRFSVHCDTQCYIGKGNI